MIRPLMRLAAAITLLTVAVLAVAGSLKQQRPAPTTSSYLALPGKFVLSSL